MSTVKRYKVSLSIVMTLIGLVILFSLGENATITAQGKADYIRHIRDFDVDNIGELNPVGLSYSPVANELLVLESGELTEPPATASDFIRIAPVERRHGSKTVAASIKDPINMAFDNKGQRVLFFRSPRSNLFEVRVDSQGIMLPGTLKPYNSNKLGIRDPQGMTFDPASGELFILDGDGPRLIHITPNAEGDFAEAVVSEVDLGTAGLVTPRGVAFDPTSNHLHIMNYVQQELYEVTKSGEVVAVRDLTGIDMSDPQGMVFAPSGDQTDDPLQLSLYLADNGHANAVRIQRNDSGEAAAPGQIVELSITPAAAPAAADFESMLVQTIDASQWSPPSPDTAGITYFASAGTLLVADSEVNEMPIFEGSNVFEITLLGSVTGTYDTTSFSDEPTGISMNNSDGHLFFSDDTGDREVYQLDPGLDANIFTPDDVVTSFPSEDYGSADPEGLTIANELGVLFVCDGVNEEVYKITPGTNTVFDGAPPTGDDQVTSFDTTAMGLLDPEGITFNPNNGNLYIVGQPETMLFEVTTAGALVQTINISAANARKPAGLTIAPSSYNPSVTSIYIVERGVDNNTDPDENDGKIYEMSLDALTNTAPTVSAGLDQTITLQDSAFLDGSTSDDGLPFIPGALNATWSQISGPGGVNIDNATSVDTSASFTIQGTYVLRLTISDGGLSADDEVTITVNNEHANTIQVPENQPTIQAGIDAASDGDLVLVSPGIYNEAVTISNKTITLASLFYTTSDEQYIDQTIIDGGGAHVISVDSSVGLETQIVGFKIRNGNDGINNSGTIKMLHNHIAGVVADGINNEPDAGGLIRGNILENNLDDGIDLDNGSEATIENNIIRNNDGDGIELRLNANTGPKLHILIHDNTISGNDNDGIKLIDKVKPNLSDILFAIERNYISSSGDVGLGLMDNGESTEDYRAASILERIHLFNNTFVNNRYAVTGGDNLIALNNIFVGSLDIAVKNIDGDSIVAHNLFWNNGIDNQGSNLDIGTSLFVDPLLDVNYYLQPGSLAIDAGVLQYTTASGETVLNFPPNSYGGASPDLGAYETDYTPGNMPPTVDAGPDQNLDLSQSVYLDGTIIDDGIPNPATINWSKVSGPGMVTFADANSEDTTVSFDQGGSYALRLTADDGEFSASDDVNINYGSVILEVAVAATLDDAEESEAGTVGLSSSDLELVYNGSNQTVGLRFNGITIPDGASIINATVQFQVDEVSLNETHLTIEGESSDNPIYFSNTYKITPRPRTTASVSWSPPPWPTVGEAGIDQRTPNIAEIIQEIVNRSGWSSGNSLALIISGTGERTAESYDGDVNGAPLLHVEFSLVPVNEPPVVSISAPEDGAVFDEGKIITFVGSATDAEEGDLTAVLSWESDLDGTIRSGGSFTAVLSAGVHTITATAVDSEGKDGSEQIGVTITVPNDPPVAAEDNVTTPEDTPVTINVIANDDDNDGNLNPTSTNTACVTCSEPVSGTLVNNADGTFDYSPNLDFNGSDGFVYEICDTFAACDTASVTIVVEAVNDPPVAVDDNANTVAGTQVTIDAAANDYDPDGDLDPATVNTVCLGCSGPANGVLTNNGDGTLVYDPNPGFDGSDSFVYEICDTNGLCDTATVTITVGDTTIQVQIAAITDDAEEAIGGRVTLSSSDLELVTDKSTLQVVGLRFNGINIPQGASVSTAHVQFKVDEKDSEPTSLFIEGEDEDNPVTFNNSDSKIIPRSRTTADVSWQPNPWLTVGEAGPDQQTPNIAPIIQEIVNRSGWSSGNSLVLIISGSGNRVAEAFDGDAAGAPLLSIEYSLGPPNDPPVAVDDAISTQEDTQVTIDVAANDFDPNGNLDPSTINADCGDCIQPANGSLVDAGPGSFTYSPDADFNGSDTFVYQICDDRGACDVATVMVTVNSVEDPPIANDDNVAGIAGSPITIDASANDVDPDGNLDPTSANTDCSGCALPVDGTVDNNGDGSFTYSPDGSWVVSDGFVYEICDTLGSCATASVNVAFGTVTLEVRVGTNTDDAEERPNGSVARTSSDLELVTDKTNIQTVGLRFNGISIPPGATIAEAYLQFKVDETSSEATTLTIQGEGSLNAATFTSVSYGISSRTRTTESALWEPVPWLAKGEAGPDQQSPDIAAIIQEIIDQPGWSSNNSLALIISGTGRRVAEAYDGDGPGAPLLHIEYQ